MPRITFPHLTYLDDGDEVVVGRRDTDAYVVLPHEGAALLRVLDSGLAPSEAAAWFEQTYGEAVDVDDFIATLTNYGLTSSDSDLNNAGRPEPGTLIKVRNDGIDPDHAAVPVRWQRLGQAVFSPLAGLAYAILVAAAVLACTRDPVLVPTRSHVFFTSSLVVIEIALTILQVPLIVFHEIAHVLAGRRLGLNGRIHVSNRYYFVVFETVMDGLVSVPRRQRYLPMLAGVLADTLTMAGLTLAAAWFRGPGGGVMAADLLGRLCLALAFTAIPRILWQGYFFLRTDGYHLVVTATGCNDLHGAGRWRILRMLGKAGLVNPEKIPDAKDFTDKDLRASRWYAPLMVLGYTLATLFTLLVAIPLMVRFFGTALSNVFGGARDLAQFADAAIILTLNGLQMLIALFLVVRRRSSQSEAATTDAMQRRRRGTGA